jgi:hypothetical protein
MTGHALTSTEGAMTLAAAVPHELYSLLMRPSAISIVSGGCGEPEPPHADVDYEERVRDGGGSRV